MRRNTGGNTPGDDVAQLLSATWRETRHAMIETGMVPQFQFRQFLFACQARILVKLSRHVEVRSRKRAGNIACICLRWQDLHKICRYSWLECLFLHCGCLENRFFYGDGLKSWETQVAERGLKFVGMLGELMTSAGLPDSFREAWAFSACLALAVQLAHTALVSSPGMQPALMPTNSDARSLLSCSCMARSMCRTQNS